MHSHNPYTLDRVVRLVIAVCLFLGALWLIDALKNVLLPFCVACLLAYMCEPFVQYNRRLLHLKGRVVAIFVTLFELVFFVSVFCYFLVPVVMDEMYEVGAVLRRYATEELNVALIPHEIQHFVRRKIDFNAISNMLTKQEWLKLIEDSLSTTWTIISSSVTLLIGLFSWFIVVLYVVFIMIDYDRLSKGFKHMVPPKYRPVAYKLGRDIQHSMNHYFRGQALVSFIVGVLFSIGFWIIGLPMAVVLGMFIGVLNMVPYLQLISFVPAGILCLVYTAAGQGDFWTILAETVAVYCIVQLIQDLFLTPKIMGKAMGLNPAIILLSLSVWGTLLGLIGLIIALPLTTLLLSYYDHYIISRNEPSEDDEPADSPLSAQD